MDWNGLRPVIVSAYTFRESHHETVRPIIRHTD